MPDDAEKHVVVKLGGNINGSKEDSYDPEKDGINLLFISFHFEKKGGMDCWKAFQLLKRNFPDAKLHLIGQKPPDEVMNTAGVVHHGVLDKADPLQLKQYEEILSKATFLIHPTRMDATPTVLIEAAYFGCPSVAPAVFGIPDLIADKQRVCC
ncbi:MAG: glycosyltransferase family 4 protein [Bacteroidia bacterium]|nr:glycosyltransferase family 4 protein [Bacteroidia bacterium]